MFDLLDKLVDVLIATVEDESLSDDELPQAIEWLAELAVDNKQRVADQLKAMGYLLEAAYGEPEVMQDDDE